MAIITEAFAAMRATFKPRKPKAGLSSLGGRNFDSSTGDAFKSTPYDVGRFFGIVEESFQRQPQALQLASSPGNKRKDFYADTTQVPLVDFVGIQPTNFDLLFGVDEEL